MIVALLPVLVQFVDRGAMIVALLCVFVVGGLRALCGAAVAARLPCLLRSLLHLVEDPIYRLYPSFPCSRLLLSLSVVRIPWRSTLCDPSPPSFIE